MLRKPEPKEGGAIGSVTPWLQMSGIPLICPLSLRVCRNLKYFLTRDEFE